jgi:hypothetical protein
MNTKYDMMRQNSKPNTMHSVKHGVINKSLYIQSIILGKTTDLRSRAVLYRSCLRVMAMCTVSTLARASQNLTPVCTMSASRIGIHIIIWSSFCDVGKAK